MTPLPKDQFYRSVRYQNPTPSTKQVSQKINSNTQSPSSMNNYNVIMLGASGSGKTVFLASMFHELSTQGNRGFFLRSEGKDEQKRLTKIYEEVVLEQSWPQGTKAAEVSEWKFTCFVQKKDLTIFPACQFTFVDYAGGRLTEIDDESESDNEFEEAVSKSDTLLGLLDGTKVLNALRGDGFAWNKLVLKDLPPILQKMQFTKVPIHFLISKWDLIEGEFTLTQVRELLLKDEHFKNIVESRREAGFPVRLIPVSSVGKGFAEPQSDGRMLKTGISPKPFQVEMPLSCVVPDMMEGMLNEFNRQKKLEAAKEVEIKANLNFLDRSLQIIGGSLGFVRIFLPEKYQFNEFFWEKAGKFVASGANRKVEEANKRTEELRQERDESLKRIDSQATALEHTINSFLFIRNILDYTFPDSDLRVSE